MTLTCKHRSQKYIFGIQKLLNRVLENAFGTLTSREVKFTIPFDSVSFLFEEANRQTGANVNLSHLSGKEYKKKRFKPEILL